MRTYVYIYIYVDKLSNATTPLHTADSLIASRLPYNINMTSEGNVRSPGFDIEALNARKLLIMLITNSGYPGPPYTYT